MGKIIITHQGAQIDTTTEEDIHDMRSAAVLTRIRDTLTNRSLSLKPRQELIDCLHNVMHACDAKKQVTMITYASREETMTVVDGIVQGATIYHA